jgi:hypothetical protein
LRGREKTAAKRQSECIFGSQQLLLQQVATGVIAGSSIVKALVLLLLVASEFQQNGHKYGGGDGIVFVFDAGSLHEIFLFFFSISVLKIFFSACECL